MSRFKQMSESPEFRIFLDFSNKVERLQIIALVAFQFFLSTLELLGASLLGIFLMNLYSRNGQPLISVTQIKFLPELQIDNLSILTVSICFLFIRSLGTLWTQHKCSLILKEISLRISHDFILKVVEFDEQTLSKYLSRDFYFVATTGIQRICQGRWGSVFAIAIDLPLIIILSVALLTYNFILATMVGVSAGLIGGLGFYLIKKKSMQTASELTKSTEEARETLHSLVQLLPELKAHESSKFFEDKFHLGIQKVGLQEKNQALLPNLNKYVLEFTFLVLLAFIAFSKVGFDGTGSVDKSLTIWFVILFRSIPIFMRIQQSLLQFEASKASAINTLTLLDQFYSEGKAGISSNRMIKTGQREFSAHISKLKCRLGDSFELDLRNSYFEIKEGEYVLVKGDSGKGKSTFIHALAGLIQIDSGKIEINYASAISSDLRPTIGFVQQESVLFSDSLFQNIVLSNTFTDFNNLELVLRVCGLDVFANNLPNGVHTRFDISNLSVSGGEKQRICLARALVTKPQLLILDEATNSLDSGLEESFFKMLRIHFPKIAVVCVSHSTSIKGFDKIIEIG